MVHPKKPAEVEGFQECPPVVKAAEKRGISQVVHFTTVRGAIGVLAVEAVRSRAKLNDDQYLEHVYMPNARLRKDPAWVGYVNLSIERINDWMFNTSARWHAASDNPWVVLSFNSSILGHPGVVFTTTNNIYPSCERAEGMIGFERMFADTVIGRYQRRQDRTGQLASWPTDRQAEVLYPDELSCEHLQRIDVQVEQSSDIIAGAVEVLNADIPINYAPEVFV